MSDAEPLLLVLLSLGARKPTRKRAAELAVPAPSGHTVPQRTRVRGRDARSAQASARHADDRHVRP